MQRLICNMPPSAGRVLLCFGSRASVCAGTPVMSLLVPSAWLVKLRVSPTPDDPPITQISATVTPDSTPPTPPPSELPPPPCNPWAAARAASKTAEEEEEAAARKRAEEEAREREEARRREEEAVAYLRERQEKEAARQKALAEEEARRRTEEEEEARQQALAEEARTRMEEEEAARRKREATAAGDVLARSAEMMARLRAMADSVRRQSEMIDKAAADTHGLLSACSSDGPPPAVDSIGDDLAEYSRPLLPAGPICPGAK